MKCVLPVVGVVIIVTGRGVDIIVYQPIIRSRGDEDRVLLAHGEITSIGIKVSQNHNVLQKKEQHKQIQNGKSTLCLFVFTLFIL